MRHWHTYITEMGVQPKPTCPVTSPTTMPNSPKREAAELLVADSMVLQHWVFPMTGQSGPESSAGLLYSPVLHWEVVGGAGAGGGGGGEGGGGEGWEGGPPGAAITNPRKAEVIAIFRYMSSSGGECV